MAVMTLQQLRVLMAVVEHRSFTRGARAVYMTQSAASQHVHSLEQALGTALVERAGGAIVPTRAGAGLVRYARDMLRLADEAERYVTSLRDGHGGRLVLGAAGSAVYLLPGLIAAFRAAYAGVDVGLRVVDRAGLQDAAAAGEVDLGLLSAPVGDARLTEHPLCPDQLVLVAAPASPLVAPAMVAPLAPDRLVTQPLIAPAASSPSWQFVERVVAGTGVHLRPASRLDTPEAVKKAVEAGLGIAFLSAWVVEREVALGTLRVLPVDLAPLTRQFVAVRAVRRAADSLVQRFLGFAPAHLARRLPPPLAGQAATSTMEVA